MKTLQTTTGIDCFGDAGHQLLRKSLFLPDPAFSIDVNTHDPTLHNSSELRNIIRLEEEYYKLHPLGLFGIMQHDNTHLLPPGIEDEEVCQTWNCEQIHHEDPRWPLVCPDAFADEAGGPIEIVTDDVEARRIFHSRHNEHNKKVASGGLNLFQKGRRHYVPGALHKQINGRFFIPEMKQPDRKPVKACKH